MAKSQVILIVEDDMFLRSLIARKLESDGFTVELALDGEEGLLKAGKTKPDLVLLDIILPKMNGFEVLEKLKNDKSTTDIPVILLTNLGEKEDASKGMSLGAAGYLVKAHFTPAEIIEKIKETLDINKPS